MSADQFSEWWIGASWKMNKLRTEAFRDAIRVARGVDVLHPRLRFFLGPAATALQTVSDSLHGTRVEPMAQEARGEPAGAFTGQISVAMALDAGATIVQAGHGESRHRGQSDDDIRASLTAAINAGAKGLLVLGEAPAERGSSGRVDEVLRQLRSAVSDETAAAIERLMIVYEPQWALGGDAATPADVQAVVEALRSWLEGVAPTGARVPILYAGGVNVETVEPLMAVDGLNGFALGRAGLDPSDFLAVAQRVSELLPRRG